MELCSSKEALCWEKKKQIDASVFTPQDPTASRFWKMNFFKWSRDKNDKAFPQETPAVQATSLKAPTQSLQVQLRSLFLYVYDTRSR